MDAFPSRRGLATAQEPYGSNIDSSLGPIREASSATVQSRVMRRGKSASGTAQATKNIANILGRDSKPRNLRQSFVLKEQKKEFLEDKFRFRVFLKFFVYHLLFPLSLPFVIAAEGLHMAYNLDFLGVASFGAFMNQWGMTAIICIPSIVMFMTPEYNRGVTLALFGLSWAMYVSRTFIVALKYAYFSKHQLYQLRTQRQQARDKSMQTLRAWSLLPKSLYGRQVRLAALRLETPEITESLLFLEPDQVPLLRRMFPYDHSLLPEPGETTISVFNLTIMLYRKAQKELKIASFFRDVLLSAVTPLTFGIWWVATLKNDTVPVTWVSFLLVIMFGWSYTYFCITNFTFLRVADMDFRRRAFALETLTSLVEVVHHVLDDGATCEGAIIPLHYAHNIEHLLTLRRLVKEFGHTFYRRIQVVMALNTIVLVGVVIGIIVLTFSSSLFVGPAAIACSFNLLVLAESLISMIIAGGNANNSVVSLMRAFRSVQIRMYVALENVDYPRLADMKDAALAHLPAKTQAVPEQGVDPLKQSLLAMSERRASRSDVIHRQCERLQIPGVRPEVEVCASNINSAARHLEDEDSYNPITLFGLTAGPNLLRFVGTLVFSAASVGLRNVIVQALELLETESAIR